MLLTDGSILGNPTKVGLCQFRNFMGTFWSHYKDWPCKVKPYLLDGFFLDF